MYRYASAMADLVEKLTREIDRVSTNVGRSEEETVAARGTPRQDEDVDAVGPGVPGAIEAPVDIGFPEGLARADIFESLDLYFGFDALDTVFGDGVYPHGLPSVP